jgi:imidazolonepropionase-like amidohydrolase
MIEDGRIALIESGRVRTGTDVIDAAGYTVMPGLIDAHVHLDGQETFDPYRRYLTPSSGVRMARALLYIQRLLLRGFTAVRDIGSGYGADVKRTLKAGLIAGPTVRTAVHALSQTGGHGDWHVLPYDFLVHHRPRSYFADGPAQCRFAVRYVLREGADLIKVFLASGGITNTPEDLIAHPNYSPEEMGAIIDEARRMAVPVAAHCVGKASMVMAIEVGVDTIEHGLLEEPDSQVLADIARSGIVLVPTLAIFHWVATAGDQYGVFKEGVKAAEQRLESHLKTVAMAHELGVILATGTDNNGVMGDCNNAVELELLVQAGLAPMEAIVAGTRNAARAIGLEREAGTIEPGKRADLVIVDGDPLEDISVLQETNAIVQVLRGPMS